MPKPPAQFGHCVYSEKEMCIIFSHRAAYLIFAEFVLKTELKWSWTGNFPSDGKIICYESVDGFPVLNVLVYFSVQIGGEIGFFD